MTVTATVVGGPVPLTPTEYRLLCALAVDAGQVVPHDRRALHTHVRRLRRKLGDAADHPSYLFAEPRVGSRLAEGGDAGDGMTSL